MAQKDTGTVNIHGKEYKTVAARVQEFREQHTQQYSIVTEIVSIDKDVVVMKASIKDPADFVIATGHAEEHRASSQINRTSALENAETSAIGRALAAFGLAGTEFASADEVAQAIHQQQTARAVTVSGPTDKELAAQLDETARLMTAPAPGSQVTQNQLNFMTVNFDKLGITDKDGMLQFVYGVLGRNVASSTELTKSEAKRVIDEQLIQIKEGV